MIIPSSESETNVLLRWVLGDEGRLKAFVSGRRAGISGRSFRSFWGLVPPSTTQPKAKVEGGRFAVAPCTRWVRSEHERCIPDKVVDEQLLLIA